MGYATQMLRAGRTHDIEDSRASTRLSLAYGVLRGLGAEPERTHGTATYFDWALAGSLAPDRHLCDHTCKVTWPEWVTDDMLADAYALADRMQTQRGAYRRQS